MALDFGPLDEAVAGVKGAYATEAAATQQQLDDAATQHQADQAALDAASALHQRDLDERDLLDAEIDRLLALLGHAPTMWGINASDPTQYRTQLARFGPGPLVWRYYQNPGEPIAAVKEYALRPGDQMVYSHKIHPAKLTVPQCLTIMRAQPPDRPFYFLPGWHEPEDNVSNATGPPKNPPGQFTLEEFHHAYAVGREAQRQVGPHIILPVCLMGYTWQKGSHRVVEEYLPDDANWDVLFSDTYFEGGPGQIGAALSTASAQFDQQIATARRHGKPWGVTETAVGRGLAGQARVDAWRYLSGLVRSKGAVLGLAFNFGHTTDEWWPDDAMLAAWKEGQLA